ncbi:MAG: phenylalanine--tRNA ligase subunit beta [Syntrophobacterales bacterium]|nr:phenylalanine--tRNA ligase subunit beta [Syntrophobacterales bacterium]
MRLSLAWLSEFVEVAVSPAELAERLTMAGLEVEAMETLAPEFRGVVVGQVRRVAPHPQADRLVVAEVTDGRRDYRVVCGAPNVAAGGLYPFAPPGAVLSGGRELKAATIRGVLSEGMLLAEDELGLSEDHSVIMELPPELPLGQDLGEALGLKDVVLEVAITPNRPDCLSVLGLAREVAALLRRPLRLPPTEVPEAETAIGEVARVTILDPVYCPRYAARLVEGLRVGPSPFWLRRRLTVSGLRAINNLVDVTNYVLLEQGQPLHAFDFDRLSGGEIVVRRPRPGEKSFVTLDGQERTLTPETLLICDREEPVALAGVMGGLESEVRPETRRVLIESAYFLPAAIRRTSKRLGLSTESSYRFERGVDPEGVIRALERAARLMAELGGGRVLKGRLDEYPTPIVRPRVALRLSRTNQVLGTAFSRREVEEVLTALHLPVVALDEEHLVVQVPSHRGDLEREIDLIEEVARLRGYEEIPVTLPGGSTAVPGAGPEVRVRQELRHLLVGMGFCEAVTYSFQSERLYGLLSPAEAPLKLANPLSEEQAVMRASLLPGLLEAAQRNLTRQADGVRLFEIALGFEAKPGEELPQERLLVAGVLGGAREEESWHGGGGTVDFFDAKGVVENLLLGLGIGEAEFTPEGLPGYLSYGARVRAGTSDLGVVGEPAPEILEALDLEAPVLVFELEVAALARAAQPFPLYTPLPRYPAVHRDLALVVDAALPAARVTAALYREGAPWLVEARLFDVYTGEQIPPGKRSLAFHLVYRDPRRTLTDEAVDRHHQKLVAALARELGAELR